LTDWNRNSNVPYPAVNYSSKVQRDYVPFLKYFTLRWKAVNHLFEETKARGLLIGKGGLYNNVVRISPPLIATREHVDEALDILEIFGGGVDGGLVMVHGHSVRDCISHLEAMMMLGSVDVSTRGLRELIASSADIIVQISRFSGGAPKVIEISAVTGTEVDLVTTQEFFSFAAKESDESGQPVGDFVATGAIPRFYEDLQRRGVKLDRGIFR